MSDSTKVGPRELYSALRFQLAPNSITTIGPCAGGCGMSARGAGMCPDCAAHDLSRLIPSVNWFALVEALEESRKHIVRSGRGY